jgi:hypothetical protein
MWFENWGFTKEENIDIFLDFVELAGGPSGLVSSTSRSTAEATPLIVLFRAWPPGEKS